MKITTRFTRFIACLAILYLWPDPASLPAQTAQIVNDFQAKDGSGHLISGRFGVDPAATYCIDGFLGEFELPVGGCEAPGLCMSFKDVRTGVGACLGEGVSLDLRPYFSPSQVDTYRVDFQFQNYPVLFQWRSDLANYYDSVKLTDVFDGSLLTLNMETVDSLNVAAQLLQSFFIIAYGPKGLPSAVESHPEVAGSYRLFDNFPNPFNPATTIGFDIPRRTGVHLAVFDMLGREVAVLVNSEMNPGHHAIVWEASDLPGGVYVARLTAGSFSATNKMVYLK